MYFRGQIPTMCMMKTEMPSTLSKRNCLHWGDTYVIDFSNPADELDGLLLVIAIDAANCSQR